MKKTLAILLASSMLAGTVLTGCSGGSSSTGEQSAAGSSTPAAAQEAASSEAQSAAPAGQTTIRMTYWNNEDTMKSLLAYLEQQVPEVKIEFQFIENSQYNTILDTQLAAGEGPDIVVESPETALKHAKVGYTEDLSKYADLYSDAGRNVYTVDGNLFALPGISWFEGVYYNVDLFTQNNIALPTTFDEWIAVCKKFQELGITPLAAGLKSWEPMLKSSMAFTTAEFLSTDGGKSFGGDYREGKSKLDGTWNPYLEKWSELITNGIYTKEMAGIDAEQALDQFATGKAAMFCSGPWDLETIKAKNPDLKFDMFPFYGTQKSDGWLIGGPGCGFAVNAKSKNKELVYKVLDAISTVEGQKAFWQENQGGSSYLKGASFEMPEQFKSVGTALAAGNVYCPWNEWGTVSSVYQDYGKELQNVLLGTVDIAQALKNVDNKAAELLAK